MCRVKTFGGGISPCYTVGPVSLGNKYIMKRYEIFNARSKLNSSQPNLRVEQKRKLTNEKN